MILGYRRELDGDSNSCPKHTTNYPVSFRVSGRWTQSGVVDIQMTRIVYKMFLLLEKRNEPERTGMTWEDRHKERHSWRQVILLFRGSLYPRDNMESGRTLKQGLDRAGSLVPLAVWGPCWTWQGGGCNKIKVKCFRYLNVQNYISRNSSFS